MAINYNVETVTRANPFDGTMETVQTVTNVVDGSDTPRPTETFEFAESATEAEILDAVTQALGSRDPGLKELTMPADTSNGVTHQYVDERLASTEGRIMQAVSASEGRISSQITEVKTIFQASQRDQTSIDKRVAVQEEKMSTHLDGHRTLTGAMVTIGVASILGALGLGWQIFVAYIKVSH